jgi:hypothetical protein
MVDCDWLSLSVGMLVDGFGGDDSLEELEFVVGLRTIVENETKTRSVSTWRRLLFPEVRRR